MTLSSARKKNNEELVYSHPLLVTYMWIFITQPLCSLPTVTSIIDLGPVPVSNCFFYIEFAPDCWLLSSNSSPSYYTLPSLYSLIPCVSLKNMGLTPYSYQSHKNCNGFNKSQLRTLKHTYIALSWYSLFNVFI